MELVSNILLLAGTLGAAVYCIVLSRRLRRFTDLETGVGGAIAVLSAQVDDMTKTLERARVSAAESADSLDQLTGRAEGVARRLELLVAAMHDIEPTQTKPARQPAEPKPEEPKAQATEEPKDEAPLFLSKRNHVAEAAE
jgi:hypothetical protein